jgi:hypothetical protein
MTLQLFPVDLLFYSFIVFCFAGSLVYLISYQPHLQRIQMATTISDTVIALCTQTDSVSHVIQDDPSKSPSQAIKELFGSHQNSVPDDRSSQSSKSSDKSTISARQIATDEALVRAKQCGRFGDCEPSELFLRMFHDALLALEHDPLAGVVSPSLMGSTGTVPLTVIGVVWDICRHMVCYIAKSAFEMR